MGPASFYQPVRILQGDWSKCYDCLSHSSTHRGGLGHERVDLSGQRTTIAANIGVEAVVLTVMRRSDGRTILDHNTHQPHESTPKPLH
eukprot:gene32505-40116_t